MNKQECIQFVTEHPTAYLATIDGDQPRVRILLTWFADESGFYFIILSTKEMYKQLKLNPKVEICFYNNPADLGAAKQLRLTGKVEFLTDEAMLAKAYEARAFLDNIAGKSVKPFVVPLCLAHGEAHFWTMMDVMKEHELERIQF